MDLYECLGVPRTATAEQIKKAYRQKAREHHPDAHSGKEEQDKHAEIFKKIVNAFDVLGDPQKRSRYDVQGVKTAPPPKPEKPKYKTKEDFEREKREEKHRKVKVASRFKDEPKDINCTFYGGGSSGRSILVQVKLTPQELKFGCTKSVTIKKREFCFMCGGDGSGLFSCPKCHGRGVARDVCGYCNTSGSVDGGCPTCKGSGMGLWMLDEVIYKVPPNTQSGHSVTIIGRGEDAPRKLPGSVRIIVL